MGEGGTQIEIAAASTYNEQISSSKIKTVEKLKKIPIVGKLIGVLQTKVLDFAEKAVEKGAQVDGLTGLLNRNGLNEKVQKQLRVLERLPGTTESITVYFIDSNKFKSVNDTLDHKAGDELLVRTSQILRGSAQRDTDSIGRVGGDEFVIVSVPSTPESEKDELAEKIFAQMEELRSEFKIKYPNLPDGSATLSIGKATLSVKEVKALLKTNPDKSLIDLITPNADSAMYQAKEISHETNNNALVMFTPPEDSQTDRPQSPAQPHQEQG